MKKNFRKIPDKILKKITQFKSDDIIVSCSRIIKKEDIKKGTLNNLGVKIEKGNLLLPQNIIPFAENGKYSNINVNGTEIKRKDLPMIQEGYDHEVPNYGDWSYGSHTVTWYKDVYQREYIAPLLIEIEMNLIDETELDYLIIFKLNFPINRRSEKFEPDLLFGINLMQENVGFIDVNESSITHQDYAKNIYVDWEILPVGKKNDIINKILSKYKKYKPDIKEKIDDRYEILNKQRPIAWVNGVSSFSRYFGAKFSDDLVVFENLEYGNAIYIMFNNWEELSKKSRVELLSGTKKDFIRIVHLKGWKEVLKNTIKEKLRK